ncbi:DUF2802 domain-containing protein [Sessilibacter sp. MAH4]
MINSFLIILSLVLGIGAVLCFSLLFVVFRRLRTVSQQHKELASFVKREITVINQAQVSMGKVLVHLEQHSKTLQQKVAQLEASPNFSHNDSPNPERYTSASAVQEPRPESKSKPDNKPQRNFFNEEFDARYLNFSDEFSFQQRLQSGSYNEALHLLKQGVSAEEVAERCGLSRSEANLMQLVNSESSAN